MKRDEIIKEIFDKVEEALYEQDEFEIEQDDEFGGVEASINVSVNYKSCCVKCYVSYHAHNNNWLEVEIEHNNGKHELSNLVQAVNNYFEKHFDECSLLDAMKNKTIEACEDEWTSHGFRNEADYYHWRYG